MVGLIIDNSVWQRVPHRPPISKALRALIVDARPGQLLYCDIQVAEVGFSAQDTAELQTIRTTLDAYEPCPVAPTAADILDLQHRLWSAGLERAVGAADTVIAAYALANDATVVHYDSDFEHVARVAPAFRHRWIVPRGSAA